MQFSVLLLSTEHCKGTFHYIQLLIYLTKYLASCNAAHSMIAWVPAVLKFLKFQKCPEIVLKFEILLIWQECPENGF